MCVIASLVHNGLTRTKMDRLKVTLVRAEITHSPKWTPASGANGEECTGRKLHDHAQLVPGVVEVRDEPMQQLE